MSLFDRAVPTPHGYRDVTPDELAATLGSVLVIDVREPGEYAEAHVPGAKLVPLATLERAAAHWDRAKPLVMVCRSGARSARASVALVALGFTHVLNLRGGTAGWMQANKPVAHGRPEPRERGA
jgi:rhodanese-related sulfurtransferase